MHGLLGKEVELSDILEQLSLDFVAVQETFLRAKSSVHVPGYQWLGWVCTAIPGHRGVEFLVNSTWSWRCNLCDLLSYDGLLVL